MCCFYSLHIYLCSFYSSNLTRWPMTTLNNIFQHSPTVFIYYYHLWMYSDCIFFLHAGFYRTLSNFYWFVIKKKSAYRHLFSVWRLPNWNNNKKKSFVAIEKRFKSFSESLSQDPIAWSLFLLFKTSSHHGSFKLEDNVKSIALFVRYVNCYIIHIKPFAGPTHHLANNSPYVCM